MNKFKKTTSYKLFQATMNVFWYQLGAAVVVYIIFTMFVMILFSDENNNIGKYTNLLTTLATELFVFYLVYKRMWKFGDEHRGDVLVGVTVRKPLNGLLAGLAAMSPTIICLVLDTIIRLVFDKPSIFGEIFLYLLFPFTPYFDIVKPIISTKLNNSSFAALLFYIPTVIPVPLISMLAFRNGMKGVWQNFTFKKNYSISSNAE